MDNFRQNSLYNSYKSNDLINKDLRGGIHPWNIQPPNQVQNRRNNNDGVQIKKINNERKNINNKNIQRFGINNNINNINNGINYIKKEENNKINMKELYNIYPLQNNNKIVGENDRGKNNNKYQVDCRRRERPRSQNLHNKKDEQKMYQGYLNNNENNRQNNPQNNQASRQYISYDKNSKNFYNNDNNGFVLNKEINNIKIIQHTKEHHINDNPQHYGKNNFENKALENEKNDIFKNDQRYQKNENNNNNKNRKIFNNYLDDRNNILNYNKNNEININNHGGFRKNHRIIENRNKKLDDNINNIHIIKNDDNPVKLKQFDMEQDKYHLNKNNNNIQKTDDNNINNAYIKYIQMNNFEQNKLNENKDEKNQLLNKYNNRGLHHKYPSEDKYNSKRNIEFEKYNNRNINNPKRNQENTMINPNTNSNIQKDTKNPNHKVFAQMINEKGYDNLGIYNYKAKNQLNNEKRNQNYSADKIKNYLPINNNEEKIINYRDTYHERQNRFKEKKINDNKEGNNNIKINNYFDKEKDLISTKNVLDNRNLSSLNNYNTVISTNNFTKKMIEPILKQNSDNRPLSPPTKPNHFNNDFNNMNIMNIMNNNANARNNMNNRNVNNQNININKQIINQRNNQTNQNNIIQQNNFISNNNNNNARKIPNNMRPVSPEQMNNIQIRKEFLNDNRNNNINSNNNRINSRSPFFYHNNFQNNNNNQNVINNNNGMNMNNMNNMHNNGMNMNMNNMHNNRMIMNNNNNNNFKVMNMNNNNFNFNGMNMNNKFINPNNINMITNQNQFNQNNNMKFNQIVPFNNNLVNNNKVNIPIMNQNQNFVQNQFILMQNQMMMNQFQNMNMGLGNNQFIQRSKSSSHFGRPVPRPPNVTKNCACGLQNIGATCYMNATLQCLAHVNVLVSFMLKEKDIIRKYSYKNKLANSFLEVLENLWQNNNLKDFAPHKFKQLISNMNPLFAGVQANDSKDLVLFLLETMHDELNKVKNKKQNNETVDQYSFENSFKSFTRYFQQNFQSVISDNFYGMYDSIMKCLNCNIVTHNIQCYNILIIPLEEVRKFKNRTQKLVNIRECFEYYQKPEYMTGQNQIYCNRCKQMANSVNSSFLIVGPKLLVINLNRGKGLQFNIKLDFDEYINISDFIYFKSTPTRYKLIGVVTHFGPSGMSGHFIAFCNSFMDNKWYRYNDSLVTPSSFQDAKNTGVPYILFYQAQ